MCIPLGNVNGLALAAAERRARLGFRVPRLGGFLTRWTVLFRWHLDSWHLSLRSYWTWVIGSQGNSQIHFRLASSVHSCWAHSADDESAANHSSGCFEFDSGLVPNCGRCRSAESFFAVDLLQLSFDLHLRWRGWDEHMVVGHFYLTPACLPSWCSWKIYALELHHFHCKLEKQRFLAIDSSCHLWLGRFIDERWGVIRSSRLTEDS